MGRKSIQAERREEILNHFEKALMEDGLEGASTGNVARRMGIPTSLLMHSFSSKAEMVEAMVERILHQYETAFRHIPSRELPPLTRLDLMLRTLLGSEWEMPEQGGLFYTCYTLSFRDEKVKAGFRQLYDRFREVLATELAQIMREGAIPTQPVNDLADFIITLVEGKGIYHPLYEEPEWIARQCDLLYRTLWQHLLRGLPPSPDLPLKSSTAPASGQATPSDSAKS